MCTTEHTARQIRHAARGELHTMMLCVDAAATATRPAEQLEWLAYMDASCDRMIALLDRAHAPSGGEDRDG